MPLSVVGCVICGVLLRIYASDNRGNNRGDPVGLQIAFFVLVVAELATAYLAAGQRGDEPRNIWYVAQAVCFVGVVGTYAALSLPQRYH